MNLNSAYLELKVKALKLLKMKLKKNLQTNKWFSLMQWHTQMRLFFSLKKFPNFIPWISDADLKVNWSDEVV